MTFRYMKIEIKKLFKRKDIWIGCALLFLIPLLFAYFTGNGSSFVEVGNSVFSGSGYVMGSLGLTRMLFLFYLFIILYVAGSNAGEIDKGILPMYNVKQGRRIPVLVSRLLTLLLLIVLMHLLVSLSSSLGWEFFLKGGKHGTDAYWDNDGQINRFVFFYMLSSILESCALACLCMALSFFFRYHQVLLFSFGYILLMKLLERVKPIREYTATYLGEVKNLYALTGNAWTEQARINTLLLLFYLFAFCIFALWRFRKMDFVR